MSHPSNTNIEVRLVCPECNYLRYVTWPDESGLVISLETLVCEGCFDSDNSEYEESTVEFVEGDTEVNPIVID